jgi:hypothetical protein
MGELNIEIASFSDMSCCYGIDRQLVCSGYLNIWCLVMSSSMEVSGEAYLIGLLLPVNKWLLKMLFAAVMLGVLLGLLP